jgi:protein-S-isoprenylcysteine O-methyltransferase Ste14
MSFQATEFEFRNRFWFISGIYALTFGLGSLDKTNAAEALTRCILSFGSHGTAINTDSVAYANAVRVIFAFGTLLLVLAALVRSWATAFLKSGVVHDSAIHSESLVADGPFRHLRNPLYLGNILQAIGIGFLASRMGFVILMLANTIFMIRLIRHEEAGLLQSQGESYRRYFEAVPRLVPSVRARVPGSGARPNWRDGIFGEMFFWILAAGLAVFTVTLNPIYFMIALATGFAIYFLQNYLRMGRVA